MANPLSIFAQCQSSGTVGLGIPTWYEGLPCDEFGSPAPSGLNDLWIIGANILDILLFIGSVAAVFYVIYGGIKMITSQGSPDKISQSRQTLIYAAVGLVVAIIARVVVQFIARELLGTSEVNVDA